MNWYKQSAIETLLDRNDLNKRIREFLHIVDTLNELAEQVPQRATNVKNVLNKIKNDKKLSSFPDIIDIINVAESKALDNYDSCSEFCSLAAIRISEKVSKMIEERNEFVPNRKDDEDE